MACVVAAIQELHTQEKPKLVSLPMLVNSALLRSKSVEVQLVDLPRQFELVLLDVILLSLPARSKVELLEPQNKPYTAHHIQF